MPLSNNGVTCCNEILYNLLFIEWGRGAEEVCSMTVSCKAHKQSWDQAKGSHGSPSFWTRRLSPVPSGIFLLPSWAVNLCYVAGVGALLCTGNMRSLCCRVKRKPSEGVPVLGQALSLLTVAADYSGRWHRSYHCCNELCSVFCECLQGRGLQQWVLRVGHVGWGCQT